VNWQIYDVANPDILTGFIVFDHRDLSRLAALDDREAKAAVRKLFAAWGTDDLGKDKDLIISRIYTTMLGWMLERNLPSDLGWDSNAKYTDKQELDSLTIVPVLGNGRKLTELSHTLSQSDLRRLLAVPVLKRGPAIASIVERWSIALEQGPEGGN
jgi:hypothetical protein